MMRPGPDRPPRTAERLLEWLAGPTVEGRSIVGDAREEFRTRGRNSRMGPRLWYWSYVALFAITHRRTVSSGQAAGRIGASGEGPAGVYSNLRRSARTLLRKPWHTSAVVATLAVGIGATVLAFTLVDTTLLRPLPYPDATELVDVSRVSPRWFGPNPSAAEAGQVFATPAATFFDWERSTTSLSSIGAYAWTTRTFTGDATAEQIAGSVATAGLFQTLGIPAAVGRSITPADDRLGAEPTVVLGHGLWVRRYGADPGVVGRTLQLDGVTTTIIGVMPATFAFPDEDTEYWVPFTDADRTDATRSAGYLHAVGRLAPGSSLDRVRAEFREIQASLGERHAAEARFIAVAYPRQAMVMAPVRAGLMLLLGTAAMVLLVACANVANLLLTRATERRREFAVRTALGASRSQLTRLLLTESLLLALVGGLAGIGLAWLAIGPFVAAFPIDLPRASAIHIDLRVVITGISLSLACGLFLGVLPTLRTASTNLERILREGGAKSSGGRSSLRSHAVLVVSEVALSVLLLATSGMFVQSYVTESHQERGFSAEGVYLMRMTLPETGYGSAEAIRTFFSRLSETLSSIPGVLEVGQADQMPYSGCCSSPPASVRTAEGVIDESIHASYVTPAYFSAMGIPVVEGRSLSPADDQTSTPVAVVSQSLAHRFWPGESAIGKEIRQATDEAAPWMEVVGVVGDVRYRFGGAPEIEYYGALAQRPRPSLAVVLKTAPGSQDVAKAAMRAVEVLAPALPARARPINAAIEGDRGYRSARVGSLILGILAAVATGLAVLGVYSLLTLTVLRRSREIAIRVSLGGERREILKSTLGSGVGMTSIGVMIGLAMSLAAGRVLRSELTGISTVNPQVLIGVVVTMLVTTIAACLLPAWRAVRVDPMVAMREE